MYDSRKLVPMEEFEEKQEDYDVDWMSKYMKRKLDNIVDLNCGEKTMMNLWNKHILQYRGFGICHMDKIVLDFLWERSHTIVEQNLYRNFVTHLSALHRINAITRETLYCCVSNMQEVMQVLDETNTVVFPTWMSQHEAAVKTSHSSSYKEKDLEAAFIFSQPKKLPSSFRVTVLPKVNRKRKEINDETIHVLTEEPPNDKHFIKMQMDVKLKAAKKVSNLNPSKVPIIYVGDDIAERVKDIKVARSRKKKSITYRVKGKQ